MQKHATNLTAKLITTIPTRRTVAL